MPRPRSRPYHCGYPRSLRPCLALARHTPTAKRHSEGSSMRAMVLDEPGKPLRRADLADPQPRPGEVLVEGSACARCRPDPPVVDGGLSHPKPPPVVGHQIVGRAVQGGERFPPGARIGIPWLGWTDGECRYCRSGRENLCDRARFTGYTLDGGYAELAVADERYCVPVPESYSDEQAAPLLCAGLIGFRALRMAGDAERLGLDGLGSAGPIACPGPGHPA